MKNIIILFFILISNLLLGQKIFYLDTINNKLPPLPFDQDFIIGLKDPLKTIDTVSLYRLFMRKGQLVDEVFLRKGKEIHKFKPDLFKDGFTYLEIPALNPDRHFEVILNHKFRGKAFDSLMEVFKMFTSNSSDRWTLLEQLSYELEPLNSEGKPRTAIGKYWLKNGIYKEGMDCFFDNKIKVLFDSVVDTINTNSVLSASLSEANLRMANTQFKKINNAFDTYSIFINVFTNDTYNVIFTGQASISWNIKVIKPHNLRMRVSNLNASIKIVDKLIASTYEVLLLDSANANIYKDMITDFENIKDTLTSNKEFITNKINAIMAELDGEKNMRYTTWFSGTNEVRDLKTQGSYFLIPNFGATHLITPRNQSNFTKPFVGVSIHLRQVDKSIPIRELKNSVLHRLAIQLGLTITEIKDDNDEYFDLMNNMSLMTGINLKVHRSIGISGGAVIMKRADPNPLIAEKQTVANFYLALAIDIDFANSLKSITGKFGL